MDNNLMIREALDKLAEAYSEGTVNSLEIPREFDFSGYTVEDCECDDCHHYRDMAETILERRKDANPS